MNRKLVYGLLVCSLLVPKTGAASEGTAGDYAYEIGTKFGRGLLNVVTSPAEIPCTMSDETKDRGAVGLATGFGQGTVLMLRRILVGVTEVGTFIIPAERTIPPVCQSKPAAGIA